MAMTDKQIVSASRFMSLVLRHKPEKVGITLDAHGWTDADMLIKAMNRAGHDVSPEDLREIVRTNDKQRFKLSDNGLKIRASQGHSIHVDVELEKCTPPDILYHGTASRFILSIKDKGLIAKGRLHVHLSSDKQAALKVGKRHGEAVVLIINSAKMHDDGFDFYLSANNVWLTDRVPTEYISQL